jgi:Tripartite tricarboxylate transporter family receptor
MLLRRAVRAPCALAITGEKRGFDLPDVPTTQEAGYPALVSETFQGMFAPAGTPAPIVQRVAHDTLQALAGPATIEKLRGVGFDVRARGGRPGGASGPRGTDVARRHRPVTDRAAIGK